ncbi:MAG: Hpt domain-containing protein [Oscillospiraceae bacterium]
MDTLLIELKGYGADVDGAMGRFLDDVDLYKSCFASFLNDEAFQKLGSAILNSDYEKAFEYAHTLKGVTGNMGLTPLYNTICTTVDVLRNKDYSSLDKYYSTIMSHLNCLKNMQL